ncbi:MAG: hypothetical protein M3R04_10070, partial [bacterium]|nr:hypothetical protein [bacterium]
MNRLLRLTQSGLLAVASLGLHSSTHAQTGLEQGALSIQMVAGYETADFNSYCLPVANSSLGRKMAQVADGGGLEWQLASNYSLVPVRFDIEHRGAIAITGHVEVTTSEAFNPAESDQQVAYTVSRDFIAPPGKPISVVLLPRVAPQAMPGQAVILRARVVYGRNKVEEELRSTQLEPAHVYSLLLTGDQPAGRPVASTINKNNELLLDLPKSMLEDKESPYLGMLSFNHYVIPVSMKSFTT